MGSDQQVWVRYGSDSVKLNVYLDCDVNDLVVAIKEALKPDLNDFSLGRIKLYKKKEERKVGGEYKDTEAEEEKAYQPDALVSFILGSGVGASAVNPFIVRTTAGDYFSSCFCPNCYSLIYVPHIECR